MNASLKIVFGSSRGWMSVLAALSVVCMMAPTMAQAQDEGRRGGGPPRGGFRGGPGGGGMMRGGMMGDPTMGLLRSEAVREEIDLDEDQVAALKKLTENAGRPERPDFDFRNASDEDRRKFFEKMQAEQKERAEEMKMDLEAILLPDQMDRLNEISIQARGMMALQDPEIIKALGLSDEQVAKLGTVREEATESMRTDIREMFQSGDREGIREKMEAMQQDIKEKVMGVLTDAQRSKFEEMKGKPFDMSQIQRPGMGGPGGDRGGRPGAGDRGGRRGGDGGRRGGGGQRRGSDRN